MSTLLIISQANVSKNLAPFVEFALIFIKQNRSSDGPQINQFLMHGVVGMGCSYFSLGAKSSISVVFSSEPYFEFYGELQLTSKSHSRTHFEFGLGV